MSAILGTDADVMRGTSGRMKRGRPGCLSRAELALGLNALAADSLFDLGAVDASSLRHVYALARNHALLYDGHLLVERDFMVVGDLVQLLPAAALLLRYGLVLHADLLTTNRNGPLHMLGHEVLPHPDATGLPSSGADAQLLFGADHGRLFRAAALALGLATLALGGAALRVGGAALPAAGRGRSRLRALDAVVAVELRLGVPRILPPRSIRGPFKMCSLSTGTRTRSPCSLAPTIDTSARLVAKRPICTAAHIWRPVRWSLCSVSILPTL